MATRLQPPSTSAHATELARMIGDPDVGIEALAAWLDALGDDHATRCAAVRALGWREQRELYEMAAVSEPLTLEHFVPGACAPLEPVVHDGKNSLPVPGPLRTFQKIFCRPLAGDDTGPGRLFGYNEGASRRVVGPGYFVVEATDAHAGWCHRGALVVDYYQVPTGEVAPGWPRVVPNGHGLQRFVYQGTRDFMRRVSRHVSIGAAYKGETRLEQFFALCRRPQPSRRAP